MKTRRAVYFDHPAGCISARHRNDRGSLRSVESGLRSNRRLCRFQFAKPVLAYEHAMRLNPARSNRVSSCALSRISQYNDPHNAAPEPNHLFPLLFNR